jgi:alpha-mannosidase
MYRSYFARWWESLSLSHRSSFRLLLASGQFEFVNGGWSQHDEACPDPLSMIQQMTTGHQYLIKQFGIVPRVAWQIDPFGHSAVTPTLFSLMGMQSLVINRIHHQIKDYFKEIKHMEFIWKG